MAGAAGEGLGPWGEKTLAGNPGAATYPCGFQWFLALAKAIWFV
jgi:hypothetical protein